MAKRVFFLALLLALAGSISVASAETLLYDNTATDLFLTVLFLQGPYEEIGNQVFTTGAARANSAYLQMYNAGGAGLFNALFRAYNDAGDQIGPTFELEDVVTTGGDSIDLVFLLGGLLLPQQFVFTAQVANATVGTDLGLNFYGPTTIGSGPQELVTKNGTQFSYLASQERLYFRLVGNEVPESNTFILLAVAVVGGSLGRRKMRRV